MSTPDLPASYVNFIIINGAVLVPQFRHELDDSAIAVLQQHFSHHHIIGIDATILIRESGALHCASVNIPKSVINENRIHTASQ
jgi:agmatine/peptidylarginine deiminase